MCIGYYIFAFFFAFANSNNYFVDSIRFFMDKGSIFYCGKRIGKNGKTFKMFKFRTMKKMLLI